MSHLSWERPNRKEDINDIDDDGNFEISCDDLGRMKKLKIAKTVNDELKFSNFMRYKYVLCKHS